MLEKIGQKLKAAREAQGLSYRQVYEKTKIPVGHLQSIDAGQADNLPEVVYVAGFIKRYGDCVGLNGQALADEYRKHAETQTESIQPAWSGQVAAAPILVNARSQSAFASEGSPPGLKTLWFNALCISLVLALVWWVGSTQFNNQLAQQDPSLKSLREAAARYNASQLPTPVAPVNTAVSPVVAASGDCKISLSASQHVWVEVKSAGTGESLYTGYLEQADRRDFQDPQGLRVRAGNGGSLTVEYKGKSEQLGQPGQVAERVFASDASATTVANKTEKDLKTSQGVQSKAAGTPKKTKRAAETRYTATRDSHYRRLDDVPSRQYIPGESLGPGTRAIDVPYRYTDGRLDAE